MYSYITDTKPTKKANHPSSKSKITKSGFPSLLNQIVIYCVVKTYTSKSNPLPGSVIAALFSEWKASKISENTVIKSADELPTTDSGRISTDPNATKPVRDFLSNIAGLFNSGYMTNTSNQKANVNVITAMFLAACFGGIISTDKSTKRAQYYFEPFLSDSDLSVLAGTIMTNPYFSPEEKDLLLKLRPLLNGGEKLIDWLSSMVKDYNKANSEKEDPRISEPSIMQLLPDHEHVRPENLSNSRLLDNISTLYNVVRSLAPVKVEVIYGRHTWPRGTEHETLNADYDYSNSEKTMLINPYGIVWRGSYPYLVCTVLNEDSNFKLRHLRIDRIISVTKKENDSRDTIPDTLSDYFSRGRFLPDKYLSHHPLMMLYKEKNIVRVSLECENSSSSVIMDVFGKNNVRLKKSLVEDRDNFDYNPYNDNELIRLTATVNAQYEDIREFCLEYHRIVRVADKTSQLFNDIKNYLSQSLEWYS